MSHMDPESVGYVTKEQVEKLTIEELKAILLFFDPSDVSNTDAFEYSHLEVEDIK